jgi:hypothetical protein
VAWTDSQIFTEKKEKFEKRAWKVWKEMEDSSNSGRNDEIAASEESETRKERDEIEESQESEESWESKGINEREESGKKLKRVGREWGVSPSSGSVATLQSRLAAKTCPSRCLFQAVD